MKNFLFRSRYIHVLFFVFLFLESSMLMSQECVGGAIKTHEAYLYGRFEVAMRSAAGDGVVSSFFLYNSDLNCNWPEENNEIDIEMTGNNETVQFTTHYPPQGGGEYPYSMTWDMTYGFNPHEAIHEYAFEWEPGIVRWFVDGEMVYTQDQEVVDQLIHPMRIHMNLWAASAESWVGVWNPEIMPVESVYEYVRYYERTPGGGDAGTDNNFTFVWEDEFNAYDEERWEITEFGGFGGNYCSFESTSVEFESGQLILQLEEPATDIEWIPVTFSVDVSNENLESTDVIYLNGGFNNWCGDCAPMTEIDGVWQITVDLPPGEHEYLFTKNFWEENGGAPLGSECDFQPCDEWQNYGFVLGYDSDPLVLETYCWATCESCIPTVGVGNLQDATNKILVKITDTLGREITPIENHLVLYHFSDGTVEKRFISTGGY